MGWLLWLAFFRHDSEERRVAGFVVVFVGAVIGMILINKVVF